MFKTCYLRWKCPSEVGKWHDLCNIDFAILEVSFMKVSTCMLSVFCFAVWFFFPTGLLLRLPSTLPSPECA